MSHFLQSLCKGNCTSINEQQSQNPGYRFASLLLISGIQSEAAISTYAQPLASWRSLLTFSITEQLKDYFTEVRVAGRLHLTENAIMLLNRLF